MSGQEEEVEVVLLSNIAIKMATEMGKVLIPLVTRGNGSIQNVHTIALGYACGALYRAIIGDNYEFEREMQLPIASQVLAKAFYEGVQPGVLAESVAKAMDEEFGPRPWDGQSIKS